MRFKPLKSLHLTKDEAGISAFFSILLQAKLASVEEKLDHFIRRSDEQFNSTVKLIHMAHEIALQNQTRLKKVSAWIDRKRSRRLGRSGMKKPSTQIVLQRPSRDGRAVEPEPPLAFLFQAVPPSSAVSL
jgi:hypothetical protein